MEIQLFRIQLTIGWLTEQYGR